MAERVNQRKCDSRKRVNDSDKEDAQMTKKRVVLGDITNISLNVSCLALNSGSGKTPKPVSEPVSKNKSDEVKVESVVSPESDVPRKFGYAPLIYQHLHSLEVEAKRRPLSNYMQTVQNDVNSVMREVLVDWLVEVAEEYKLVSDTLYLTVNYIDRYLSSHKLNRNKLQLLGVSCMLVASKYEEISPPHVEDFCYITDNTYTKEEVMLMESEVLKLLNFEIGSPTTKTFLRIFIKIAQEEPSLSNQFDFLCYYLAELSLLDYGCIRYLPSIVAASAVFLSRLTIQPNFHPWGLVLQQRTGYRPYELKECVIRLHKQQLKSESAQHAVRQKYMNHKFKCVAWLKLPTEIPAHYFEESLA